MITSFDSDKNPWNLVLFIQCSRPPLINTSHGHWESVQVTVTAETRWKRTICGGLIGFFNHCDCDEN